MFLYGSLYPHLTHDLCSGAGQKHLSPVGMKLSESHCIPNTKTLEARANTPKPSSPIYDLMLPLLQVTEARR